MLLGTWPRVVVCAALLALAACGGDPPTKPPTDDPDVLTLTRVSGHPQVGIAGQPLAEPFVVAATKNDGVAASGETVVFAVTAGGGTLSTTSVTTDANGRAATVLTLGAAAGTDNNAVTAALSGATGSPITFTASGTTASDVSISAVSVDSLVAGQPATITGDGFSATASANTVTIAGVAATVTAASPTSLTITVPASVCEPAGTVAIQVAAAGGSATRVHPFRPAGYLDLAVGTQRIIQNPGDFCLQFDRSSAAEAYLIGMLSTSEAVSSVTPVTLRSVTTAAAGGAPPLAAPMVAAGRSMPGLVDGRRSERLRAHREAELALRRLERELTPRLRGPSRAAGVRPATASIPPGVAVGDVVPINFPDIGSGNLCSAIPITTTVKHVGTRGVWLEDNANATPGLTAADYQVLGDKLDDLIYDVNVSYFGAPSDIDGNARIGIVITRQVNVANPGILGFVTNADLATPGQCASSNEGEIYYGKAPAADYPASAAVADGPFLIAHEFTHIIQFSRRQAISNAPNMTAWEMEGQATFAEEVVGHADEGHDVGENLGFDVAFNTDEVSTDWYSDRFVDLALYQGFETSTSRVTGAPEQCSWLARAPANPDPCIWDGREVYGVPSLLLRWMSDHFGPTFPGGEQGLQKALIDNTAIGFANLSARAGVGMDVLLAEFAAMLYVDERVPGAAARLTLPSWNLRDVDGGLNTNTHLLPRERGFAAFSDALSVRGAASSYHRVSGATRGPTAIGARGPTGVPLPSTMRMWVVRLQ